MCAVHLEIVLTSIEIIISITDGAEAAAAISSAAKYGHGNCLLKTMTNWKENWNEMNERSISKKIMV